MAQTPLYTSQQAAEIDAGFIERHPQQDFDLMWRAGQRIADLVIERYAGRQPVVVVCGGGNNGGDGYVAALHLHQLGIAVRVVALSPPSTVSCARAEEVFVAGSGTVSRDIAVIEGAEVIVDAMLGAGLSRAPEGKYAKAIRACNASDAPILAVDLPSGLDGSSGGACDPVIRADITVTFSVRKVGLFTGAGKSLSGTLAFDSLGVDPHSSGNPEPAALLTAQPVMAPRPADSHKGQYGRVAVLGGDHGMAGAIILAARAALRGGSGSVTVGTRSEHAAQISLAQPELMTRDIAMESDVHRVLSEADVVVCGPGTRADQWSEQLLIGALSAQLPGVIDAGGLRCLAQLDRRAQNMVLTPHPGEAAALLGCRTVDVQQDRCAAARLIARQYDCVAVLKGAGTVVSDGDRVEICEGGNPGMASAGMGDVLAGLIGALLGQGFEPCEAACAGVHLHARAANIALETRTEQTLIASDVIDDLSAAFGA